MGGAEAAPCRLALLLALDVSASVDASEHDLQRDGLAAALNDADVRRAILLPGRGIVALAAFEWSGRYSQRALINWTNLRSNAAIDRAIAALVNAPRSREQEPTALGYALGHGAGWLARGPDCARRVIDVSGDGVTNEGFGPQLAYKHFPFDGVVVNGLAVLGADSQVQRYYEENLRHGPGAFVETSQGYTGFQRAMTRKLYREINDLIVGTLE